MATARAGVLSCSLWWSTLICQLRWTRKCKSTFLGVCHVVTEAESWVLGMVPAPSSGTAPCSAPGSHEVSSFGCIFQCDVPAWESDSRELNSPELWGKLNFSSFKLWVLDIVSENGKADWYSEVLQYHPDPYRFDFLKTQHSHNHICSVTEIPYPIWFAWWQKKQQGKILTLFMAFAWIKGNTSHSHSWFK